MNRRLGATAASHPNRSTTWGVATALAAAAAVTVLPSPTLGQLRAVARPGLPAAAGGQVNLPYAVPDQTGNQWRVYYNGYLQQSGNMPIYSQGATLTINGNQPPMQNRMAKLDDKTGELILDGLTFGSLTVTRRISFEKDANVVRYIDVVKNATGQDQALNFMISTNLNYGVNTTQLVPDPKKKDQQVAWVAQTGGNAAAMEMFAGKGAKVAMGIVHQPGNNVVTANLQQQLKAGQEIAIMHLHGTMPTQAQAADYVTKLKEADLLKRVPPNIRKILVNFAAGGNFVGDVEVLRGDISDVVELRGGDQLRGTVQADSYELNTFYGPVTLPVDKVVAVMNVGNFRPRQLVVTADGQIFGGQLKQDSLSLQLASGQVTKVPLSQVVRMGYRKRAGEPEEWALDKPMVMMRTGERVGVKLPTTPFEVATRYGKLSLKPEQLAAIVLQSDDAGLHQFVLADGSKFGGLLAADALEMTLEAGGGPDQVVKFPVSGISRVQFSAKPGEADDASPMIKLANDDLLVGTVGGELKVDTAFDTLTLTAAEVRELRRTAGPGADVQAVLFDGTTVSGQLQALDLAVKTVGGLSVNVPIALLEEYLQPAPAPSKEVEAKVATLVKDLSNQDWKAQDRAQQGLVAIGPAALGPVKRARDAAPAGPAKQRLEDVLKELEKMPAGKAGTRPGARGGPGGQPANPAAAQLNKDGPAPLIFLNKD
jgi:hypothetical protein